MVSDSPPQPTKSRTIQELSPKERKDLRRRGILPHASHTKTYYRRQADAIYALEMREAVMRMYAEKVPVEEIAKRLGQTTRDIKWWRRKALKASTQREIACMRYGPPQIPAPPILPAQWKRRLRQWEDIRQRKKEQRMTMLALPDGSSPNPSSSPPATTGELLEPPDIVQTRKECLVLRKAMKSFDQIGDLLGITEQEARQFTYEALQHLQQSEMNSADLERRLMLEQLDEMMAAIHPFCMRLEVPFGNSRSVFLEAIDRMLKLMKQKAELLGLTEPPAIDIRLKLQQLAAENNYDVLDLEEIARGVLATHKIRLPDY